MIAELRKHRAAARDHHAQNAVVAKTNVERQPKPRAELLELAQKNGAFLTGKPDAIEIQNVFTAAKVARRLKS